MKNRWRNVQAVARMVTPYGVHLGPLSPMQKKSVIENRKAREHEHENYIKKKAKITAGNNEAAVSTVTDENI